MSCVTRLFAVVRKELRQLGRDRLTFGMIAGIPLLQVMLFGYAINTDVRHLSAGVADQAGTELSRQLIADSQASQVIDLTHSVTTAEGLLTLLRRGDIMVGIAIPPDFERRLQQPDRAAALLLVDGADPVVLSAARQLAQMTMHEDTAVVSKAKGVLFEVYNPYNPERRSSVHIVPGLIGVILTMTMAMFTGVAIVRERERGNMEMLITTPVRNFELMVGKVLPYVGIGLIQVTLILLLGHFLFRVPIRGQLEDVYLAALAFITANLGIGLVISTLAQSQFQAMQMTFFFFLPSILLSGFMFPFDGMPFVAQNIALLLPLTHFLRLIRGIMLRGASLWELHSDLQALGIFATVMLTLATLRFRKSLD